MAKNKGWWTLELDGNSHEELSDCDREHIAKSIIEGYTNGQVVEAEE